MLLRQSYKGGIRDYTVLSLQQANDIVALLNICHSYSLIMAKKQDVTFREMAFCIADIHDLYDVMREMLFDFGDCMFTLLHNNVEYIMNVDRIEFVKKEAS